MKILLAALLLLSSTYAEAALLKPESAEGRRVIRRLADEATKTFVNQTDFINSNGNQGHYAANSCENSRDNLLKGIGRLELNKAPELVEAKFALERARCPSAPAGPLEIRQAQNGFFAATLFLRESDARVN